LWGRPLSLKGLPYSCGANGITAPSTIQTTGVAPLNPRLCILLIPLFQQQSAGEGVYRTLFACQESAVDSTANMGQVTFLSRLDILGVLPCFTLFSRKNRVSLRYGSGDIWQVYTRVAARAIVAWRPLSCSGS
jgi:hypothetical protein